MVVSPRTPLKNAAEHFRFSPKHDMRRSSGNGSDRTTRSIGTSPHKELKAARADDKNLLSPVKLDAITTCAASKLEKANSVDERKPQRNLRTTRSLSPRPPVRHQHAITVSDENDVTQIKLSPNDELDDVFNHHRQSRGKRRDDRSPSLTESSSGAKKERGLVYVPSDPWLLKRDPANSPKKRRPFDAKSVDDPWELREDRKRLQRQAKSLTSKSDEPYILTLPDAKSRKTRLQRSKSPAFHDESIIDRQQLPKYKSASNLIKTDSVNKSSLTSIVNEPPSGPRSLTIGGSSDQKMLLSLSPTLGYHTLSDFDMSKKKSVSLTIGTHHLQPRHSFSTAPLKRADELQLNIRRLSEQMRDTYQQQNGMMSPPKVARNDEEKPRDAAQKKLQPTNIESLLETRC